MLNPRNLANGQEQHVTFRSSVPRKKAVQYDYRRNQEMMNKSKIEKG